VSMGETCVTVTWLQLTAQLLALTGEAAYADELERTLLNHLAGAQLPDGSAWCYYSPLDGFRSYSGGISCCVSSGPRGMAMAPSLAFGVSRMPTESLAVCLYEDAVTTVTLDGQRVEVRMTSQVPFAGGARLSFGITDGAARFGILLRRPQWVHRLHVVEHPDAKENETGWLEIPARDHRDGDSLTVEFDLGLRQITGERWNAGKAALAYGPLVLAYEAGPAAGTPPATNLDALPDDDSEPRTLTGPKSAVTRTIRTTRVPDGRTRAVFRPFSEVGADGDRYRVWVSLAEHAEQKEEPSVFADAAETLSGGDPRRATVVDGDRFAFASTDGGDGPADWFAVSRPAPRTFRRVVYTHGRSLVHGGWFDASSGKPRVEVRRTPNSDWEQVAELEDYPDTTATDDRGLQAGQRFIVELTEPVTASALRVIGLGSYGDYPPRRFVTCAELAAYESGDGVRSDR
jgi:uncharacterized protein